MSGMKKLPGRILERSWGCSEVAMRGLRIRHCIFPGIAVTAQTRHERDSGRNLAQVFFCIGHKRNDALIEAAS